MKSGSRLFTISLLPIVVCFWFLFFGSGMLLADSPELVRIHSKDPMTLEQLLNAAKSHNYSLQKARADLSVNRLLKLDAMGEFLPSLSVGYQISQSDYYSPTYTNPDGTVSSYPYTSSQPMFYVDSLGYYRQGDSVSVSYSVPEGDRRSSSFYISLQTSLNLGGQEIFGLSNAKKSIAINKLSLESTELDVESSVRQQYYWVLAYQKLLELSKRVLGQTEDQLELAQALYDVGSVTELDVLQADIDVGNQENDVLSSEHNLQMAREELNRLLGIDLSSEYPLVDDFRVTAPEYDLNQLVTRALQHRPDMKVSELTDEMYWNNVKISKGNYMPYLTASIYHSRSEQSGGNVAFTLDPRNKNTQYSLGLSWTLFNGFSREKLLQESKVAHRKAELDRVVLEQTIEQAVRQAYYTLIRIWDQSQVTEENRELAQRQLELEQERYRLGSASRLELRTAQVTYIAAETDHIYKTLEYLINLALLEEAVGGSLVR